VEREKSRQQIKIPQVMKTKDETLDTFYLGRIFLFQKKNGYRFSVDAPLLADFIKTKTSEELLELGCGNGVISLLLSIKSFKQITALEIQKSLAELARRNVILNKLEDKITVIQIDLRRFNSRKKFDVIFSNPPYIDVIFSNPPYIKRKKGQLSPVLEKSIAKHEIKCDIFNFFQSTLYQEEKRTVEPCSGKIYCQA